MSAEHILPRLADRWRTAVLNLESTLGSGDVARARSVLHDILGDVVVVADAEEIRLETKKGAIEGAFLRTAVASK